MLSVIIETLNSERPLACTLSGLVPAVVEGLLRRVTVIDHGSVTARRLSPKVPVALSMGLRKGMSRSMESARIGCFS